MGVPKKTKFIDVSNIQITEIQDLSSNNRLRKVFGYKTSYEVFFGKIADSKNYYLNNIVVFDCYIIGLC